MNELNNIREEMLEAYDSLIDMHPNPSEYTEGFMMGLRTAIEMVVTRIERDDESQ